MLPGMLEIRALMLVTGAATLSVWMKAASVTTRIRQALTRAAGLFINTSS